jgi:hypothetical protein
MEGMTKTYKILVRKPEERQFGRTRGRWEDIRMYLREIDEKLRAVFIWLRTGTNGGLL